MQQTSIPSVQLTNIDVIIIRGAPGSGKSSVAKSLASHFPKGVRLEVDTLRSMVISVDWKNQEEHSNMLQLSAKMVNEFLQLNFSPVIVVDTFSGNKLQNYITTLQQLRPGASLKVFGLYTTEKELKKRIAARSSGEFKELNICLNLNKDVLRSKGEEEVQIDTSGLLASEVAKLIVEHISNPAFC